MHPFTRKLSLAALLAACALLGGPPAEADAQPAPRSIRVVYLVPEDRQHRRDYHDAIERAVLDLQVWYFGHLDGRTFRLNEPVVEVRRTPHRAAWYHATTPAGHPEERLNTWYNAYADARAIFGAEMGDPRYVWLVYIDAPGGTGAGASGIAILPEHDLQGLAGKAADGTGVPRWIGGSGHELGHALGLEHPGASHPQAIMEFGYLSYPAAYLTPGHVQTLGQNPFIHRERPPAFAARGRFLYLYDGGYFVRVAASRWEERKTATDTVFSFAEEGEDASYRYLLDRSRSPGAWIRLPKEGRGDRIGFRWEGEPWRELYVAR